MAALVSKLFNKLTLNNDDDIRRGSELRVDVNSNDPIKAWQIRSGEQVHRPVPRVDPDKPISETSVRVVCISDTHTRLEKHPRCLKIPDGDILVHSGDFTMYGYPDDVNLVNLYLGTLPHKYKIVIAGNHDMTFDLDFVTWRWWTHPRALSRANYQARLQALCVDTVHDLMTNVTYLQDAMVDICGVKIYGAPWQPGTLGYWGFNLQRGRACLDKWAGIPADTDILLTHGPPLGHGDLSYGRPYGGIFNWLFSRRSLGREHVGCVDLLNTIQTRVKPRYHVFGHIHEGYGMSTDGTTTFVNASTCDVMYMPINPPIVFDVPLPEGHTKDEPLKWVIENKLTGSKHTKTYRERHVRDRERDVRD